MFGREELELHDVNGVHGTIYYPECVDELIDKMDARIKELEARNKELEAQISKKD